MLLRTADVVQSVRGCYARNEFHRAYHRLHDFCIVDLSALYFDVLKDRLYTFAPRSRSRRSAQTAVWRIGEALVRLLAPMMSFTADEIWQFLPPLKGREESVHLSLFPAADEALGGATLGGTTDALRADWELLLQVRQEVLKAMEAARNAKTIGGSLEAAVRITAQDPAFSVLERHLESLRALFIVSGVSLERALPGNSTGGILAEVERAPGSKCERCWNYSSQVGDNSLYPTACERCVAALEEIARSREKQHL